MSQFVDRSLAALGCFCRSAEGPFMLGIAIRGSLPRFSCRFKLSIFILTQTREVLG